MENDTRFNVVSNNKSSDHKSMVKIPYNVKLRAVFTAGNPGPAKPINYWCKKY
ncbi:hypothetical protein MTR_2g089775 [Medicago truncatula]|uniref:Uncharacterized protein n=1 Tax=Medicago truncatula TaxID=3880 RepID=A0A072VLK2_MEDTR|nr:hypothetical protein MTR_2g089775 [Medicago truncatula]